MKTEYTSVKEANADGLYRITDIKSMGRKLNRGVQEKAIVRYSVQFQGLIKSSLYTIDDTSPVNKKIKLS